MADLMTTKTDDTGRAVFYLGLWQQEHWTLLRDEQFVREVWLAAWAARGEADKEGTPEEFEEFRARLKTNVQLDRQRAATWDKK